MLSERQINSRKYVENNKLQRTPNTHTHTHTQTRRRHEIRAYFWSRQMKGSVWFSRPSRAKRAGKEGVVRSKGPRHALGKPTFKYLPRRALYYYPFIINENTRTHTLTLSHTHAHTHMQKKEQTDRFKTNKKLVECVGARWLLLSGEMPPRKGTYIHTCTNTCTNTHTHTHIQAGLLN